MTVVDATGGVLGGCCQVSKTKQLIESTFSTFKPLGQDGTSTYIVDEDRNM